MLYENRRREWASLPAEVKQAVASRAGSVVVAARTQPGGFTSGVAAVLRFEDGSSAFVKALPVTDGMAVAYRKEAIVARQLPLELPASRLQYSFEIAGWIVLSFVALDGSLPELPWRDDQLAEAIVAIDGLRGVLTPSPVADLPVIADVMRDEFAVFRRLAEVGRSGLASVENLGGELRAEIPVLADLESTWESSVAGDTLVHFDLRADNLLFTNGGGVSIVDWSSPCLGAPWIDLATFLPTIGRSGRELNERFLATAVGAAGESSKVDAFLVALAGMWLERSHNAPVVHVPGLRTHQARCGAAALEWLRCRRDK
jgi:hypothetical protein